jgi:hypothetical protein
MVPSHLITGYKLCPENDPLITRQSGFQMAIVDFKTGLISE